MKCDWWVSDDRCWPGVSLCHTGGIMAISTHHTSSRVTPSHHLGRQTAFLLHSKHCSFIKFEGIAPPDIMPATDDRQNVVGLLHFNIVRLLASPSQTSNIAAMELLAAQPTSSKYSTKKETKFCLIMNFSRIFANFQSACSQSNYCNVILQH